MVGAKAAENRAKIEDETGMDHAVAASSSSSSSSSSSAAPAFFTGPMAQPQGVKKEDEDDGESVTIGGVGVQKKKVALRLAYVGKAYMGMQMYVTNVPCPPLCF